jgi:hypothetical protein
MLGSGPARPVGLGPNAQLELAPPSNFGSATWGGANNGSVPSLEKALDPTGKTPRSGGWFDFPGYTRVEHSGCYAYQIDTAAGTTTVVFLVI